MLACLFLKRQIPGRIFLLGKSNEEGKFMSAVGDDLRTMEENVVYIFSLYQ